MRPYYLLKNFKSYLQVGFKPNELAEALKVSEDYGCKAIRMGCLTKSPKNKFGACLFKTRNCSKMYWSMTKKQTCNYN